MRKLLIFFILFIFSAVSFSGTEVEKYVLEQHNKIFKYINNSENLLKEDRTKSRKKYLKEYWEKKITQLLQKNKRKILI